MMRGQVATAVDCFVKLHSIAPSTSQHRAFVMNMEQPKQTDPPRLAGGNRWPRTLASAAAGWLMAVGALTLGLDAIAPFQWARFPLLAALACAGLGWLRGRRACGGLWLAAGLPWLGLLIITATPAAGALARSLSREDPPRPAAAIVVLSSDIRPDGTPDRGMQRRLNHAYDLVRAGYARRLVVPRLGMRSNSYAPAIKAQLEKRGLKCEVEELGPVRYTHDEIKEIGRYLEQPGRGPLILVTEALHMRRVSALCRKAGVVVQRSPCGYDEFDHRHPTNSTERLAAFRTWLQETFYYELNRWLGWL
ncbi:MAG: YdcF family protein [Actinomycetota bacterium]